MPRASSLASLPTCNILPRLPEQPAHPSVETLATEKLGHVALLVTIAGCIRSTVEKSKPSMDCNDIGKTHMITFPCLSTNTSPSFVRRFVQSPQNKVVKYVPGTAVKVARDVVCLTPPMFSLIMPRALAATSCRISLFA